MGSDIMKSDRVVKIILFFETIRQSETRLQHLYVHSSSAEFTPEIVLNTINERRNLTHNSTCAVFRRAQFC